MFEARAPDELDRAFAQMIAGRCDAVLVQAGSMFAVNTRTTAELALRHRLPSASALYDFAEAGGLITYGPDRLEGYRRAAVFVDRILKGAKPADLPDRAGQHVRARREHAHREITRAFDSAAAAGARAPYLRARNRELRAPVNAFTRDLRPNRDRCRR